MMSMINKKETEINNDGNYIDEKGDDEVQKRARMNRTLLEANIEQFLFERRDLLKTVVWNFPKVRDHVDEKILQPEDIPLKKD